MSALNAAAKAALRDAGVSQPAWARHWFPCNGKPGDSSTQIGRPVWLGDACGCTDDRCIGYHHDEHAECGCLPVLLGQYDGPRTEPRYEQPGAAVYVADWREHQMRSEKPLRGVLRVLVDGQHCGAAGPGEAGWLAVVHGQKPAAGGSSHETATAAVEAVLRSSWARRLGYRRKTSQVFWSDKAKALIRQARTQGGAR